MKLCWNTLDTMQRFPKPPLAPVGEKSKCCVEITNVKSPTIAGKEICVDPETAWVSGHVNKVSKRTTTHTLMQILITYN
uniref:Chemokine interleukin-8-like domain-containing protein n=1 Tax=Cyprinus carpio carpio TaxID=630221 RepID=A0A8C1A6B7_CYPCA